MLLQERIDFTDTSCVLLTSAKFRFRPIDLSRLLNRLEAYFHLPRWNKDSYYAKEFLEYKNIVFNKEFKIDSKLKVKLGKFSFDLTYNSNRKKYSVEVFAFIYPVIDVVNLFYSIPLEDMTVDELIYFRKAIQFDKFKKGSLKLNNTGFLKTANEFDYTDFDAITKEIYRIFVELSGYPGYKVLHTFASLGKKLALIINELLGKTETAADPAQNKEKKDGQSLHRLYMEHLFEKINIEKLLLLEIRRIPDFNGNCANDRDFKECYAKKLYGILVCDEGYEFVPDATVDLAIDESFGSRDFFRVYASNIGVVMFNLINCECRIKYNDFQKEIGERFQDNSSGILTHNPVIAGMEHGALLAMEESINLLTIINSNLRKSYLSHNRKISKIIDNRRKLIEIINLISSININEITNLKNLMLKKIGILAFVSKVRERLDIAENDTLVIYQRRNNFLVMVITVLGVFFAAMSISEIKSGIVEFLKNLFTAR